MFGRRNPALVALLCGAVVLACIPSCRGSESAAPPAPPACSLNTTSLNFGTVTVGQPVTRTFTVTNSGGGVLIGTVTAGSAPWSVVGTATYTLSSGKSATFTVSCAPTQAETLSCDVPIGTSSCGPVHCTATARLAPAGQVAPALLDFGTVTVGQAVNRTFTITNPEAGTLSGSVSAPCPGYSIVGPATYSLGANQTSTFTIRFQPASEGTWTCAVTTSSGGGPVSCTGRGWIAPACRVEPTALDFGAVTIGQTADRTFTITNTGGGQLSGTVSSPCAAYSVVGSASYSLGADESQMFTVRFAPTAAGGAGLARAWKNLISFGKPRPQARPSQECVVSTGAGLCSGVSCYGTGEPPPPSPVCHIFGTELDFGTVAVGQFADRTFTITNTGGGTLSGAVSVSCIGFSIVGNTAYSLGRDQTASFKVRFAPPNAGTRNCTVSTGAACGAVSCTGNGL
jgi:hypothetical protein